MQHASGVRSPELMRLHPSRRAVVAGRRRVIRGKVFVMLTSQKVIDAINEQIGYEFSASLQYYAIGAHFAAEALPQLSQHFFQQAEEEKGTHCGLSNTLSMPVDAW